MRSRRSRYRAPSRAPSALLVLQVLLVLPVLPAPAASAASLEHELGRSEVRVRSAPYPLVAGITVERARLAERLERLGYRRVHEKPARPGEYFWGHEVFWIHRRAHRSGGVDRRPSLIGLELRRADGMILGATSANGRRHRLDAEGALWIEPETLSESLAADRAERLPVRLDDLPEHVWRAVLAAEDARFLRHSGVDGRALARAALANLREGRVAQGGSTLTQQLVKNRDMTPKRTIGRKLSEAARALALEAEYDKREILEAYLNHVYLGHLDGLALHGIGAASRAYFSKGAAELTLAESALLAAMIQGPNRLSPLRHADRARSRRDWVLGRMQEHGWATPERVREARRQDIRTRVEAPSRSPAGHFVRWVASIVEREMPGRVERGRGAVIETTLDPLLQQIAERAVAARLAAIRREFPRLGAASLSAALVALDARTGEVLAHVGGDPAAGQPGIDRARNARRQPGSTVKPLVLLEAFEDCGKRRPLHPATRVLDEPLTLELPSGPWEPQNHDGRFRGVVSVREALVQSINVPFVRIGRACGLGDTAAVLRRTGLDLPANPPPSFLLGAVETTPLELAEAFTVFATPGRVARALPVRRTERPGGRPLQSQRPRRRRVVSAASAYLVRDLMREAVEQGTARVGAIAGLDVAAKTGSSSELRDAWFAGHVGSIVVVVWVGLDDGSPLGLSGARAAGPIWREFAREAAPARPPRESARPGGLVEHWVDPETGLRVGRGHGRARRELFRHGVLPARKRFWRPDHPTDVVR